MIIIYTSNNSGGRWWLSDEDWQNLENAGWDVLWAKYMNQEYVHEGRYMGALSREASKEFPTIEMAMAEWEYIIGQDPEEEGCSCCGRPHNFDKE